MFIIWDLPTGQRYMMKLPLSLPYLRPLSLNRPYSLIMPPYSIKMTNIEKMSSYGKCKLDRTTLQTFDGHSVALPRVFFEPNCEMLVARDCSRERFFTLTQKPIKHDGQRAIQLVTPEYKIEVIPSIQEHWYSWNKNVDYEVRINGEPVSLKTQNPIILKSKENSR
jgi:hypothetical protein